LTNQVAEHSFEVRKCSIACWKCSNAYTSCWMLKQKTLGITETELHLIYIKYLVGGAQNGGHIVCGT